MNDNSQLMSSIDDNLRKKLLRLLREIDRAPPCREGTEPLPDGSAGFIRATMLKWAEWLPGSLPAVRFWGLPIAFNPKLPSNVAHVEFRAQGGIECIVVGGSFHG